MFISTLLYLPLMKNDVVSKCFLRSVMQGFTGSIEYEVYQNQVEDEHKAALERQIVSQRKRKEAERVLLRQRDEVRLHEAGREAGGLAGVLPAAHALPTGHASQLVCVPLG